MKTKVFKRLALIFSHALGRLLEDGEKDLFEKGQELYTHPIIHLACFHSLTPFQQFSSVPGPPSLQL